MTPQNESTKQELTLQQLLSNPDVQAGMKIAGEHRYCHEYQSLVEQGEIAMLELVKAIQAHAATCTNPYTCDQPCCFDKIEGQELADAAATYQSDEQQPAD